MVDGLAMIFGALAGLILALGLISHARGGRRK
jgi:hypothetical protein